MTPEQFDAVFDEDWDKAFRLETQRVCLIPAEAQRVQAFANKAPRPVRSVRNDPWLARIARTSDVTLAHPKLWQHVMVLDRVLTDYQRYRLVGLVESQAAGEDVRILLRDREMQDFWLFTGGTYGAAVVWLFYDADGRWTGARFTRDPAEIGACSAARDADLGRAVPLNEYLASGRLTRAA